MNEEEASQSHASAEGPPPSAADLQRAREVQVRLLQRRPVDVAATDLQCEGRSIPARSVGGDYFDFLETGQGRPGLVVADISGKGISAALMMASLQASFRSLCAAGITDLDEMLDYVNRLFTESTATRHYASLFLAAYDDQRRRLRYVNCGHVAPLLVHADGTVKRLVPTSGLLGLFRDWRCFIQEVTLEPGDTLLVFSDGVTESCNGLGEVYGESRLLACFEAARHLPVPELVEELLASCRRFEAGSQADDMTIVVARFGEQELVGDLAGGDNGATGVDTGTKRRDLELVA